MGKSLFPDVIVNGEAVPHALIASEAQNHSAPRTKPGLAWRKAANAIAIRTLLLQEARRRGIAAKPRAVGPDQTETEDEALVRELLDECIAPHPPTHDQVRAEWNRDPSRFRAPCLWEASHILVACDRDNPTERDAAHVRAMAIADALAAQPEQFHEIAQTQSDCGSKTMGGALAQISPGDTVPEFELALRKLKEGEITESPILTQFGWHIIRLDAYLQGEVLPFRAVQQKLKASMEKAAWGRAAKEYIEQLVASADISGADP